MIYFALCREANAVKIGVARDHPTYIHKRVSMLQTGCPLRIDLVGVIDGSYADERLLLERFASARIHGEWFRITAELAALLSTIPPAPERPERQTRGNKRREWFEQPSILVSA